jgi:hypothetical protein
VATDANWWDEGSSWWAKANRAQEHLRSLRQQVDDYRESEAVTVVPEPTGVPDRVAYRLRKHRPVPVAISTTIGDVLHNLRSALDNLAYEVARRSLGRAMNESQERACEFPVCATPKAFDRFFESKSKPERAVVYGQTARAALRLVQPFVRAEQAKEVGVDWSFDEEYRWSDLRRLTLLWNIDKHRRLAAVDWWGPSFTYWMSNTEKSNRRWIPAPPPYADGSIIGYMQGSDPGMGDEVFHEFNLVLEDDPVYDLSDLACNAPGVVDLLEGWHGQITTVTFPTMFRAM